MGLIYGVLIVFEGLLSLMLIAIIFMQKTKGGMGGTAFGGGAGEAIFGSRMGNVLTKATVVLGAIFLVNTIFLTILTARQQGGGSVMDSVDVAAPVQQPEMPSGMPGGMPDVGALPADDTPVDVSTPEEGDLSAMPDADVVPVEVPMPDVPPAIEPPVAEDVMPVAPTPAPAQ